MQERGRPRARPTMGGVDRDQTSPSPEWLRPGPGMVYRPSELLPGRGILGLGRSRTLEAHRVERKLAAIFAADVEGYSRLMGR